MYETTHHTTIPHKLANTKERKRWSLIRHIQGRGKEETELDLVQKQTNKRSFHKA